jgi:hypothetical protein
MAVAAHVATDPEGGLVGSVLLECALDLVRYSGCTERGSHRGPAPGGP